MRPAISGRTVTDSAARSVPTADTVRASDMARDCVASTATGAAVPPRAGVEAPPGLAPPACTPGAGALPDTAAPVADDRSAALTSTAGATGARCHCQPAQPSTANPAAARIQYRGLLIVRGCRARGREERWQAPTETHLNLARQPLPWAKGGEARAVTRA